MRRALSGTGRVLITVGLLILLFVAYQLWGTNILQARAQNELESEFAQLQSQLVSARASATTTPPTTGSTFGTSSVPSARSTSPPTTESGDDPTFELASDGSGTEAEVDLSGLPRFAPGDPLGQLMIPEAGVNQYFVVGVGRDELKKGPGHYPGTPMPGARGVAAIAGHRTTYGAPFFDIDDLHALGDPTSDRADRRGDLIVTETLLGTHAFEVVAKNVVGPDETWVAAPIDQQVDPTVPQLQNNWQLFVRDLHRVWDVPAPTDESGAPRWTDELGEPLHLDPDGAYVVLTSCHPRFSAAQRIVILAQLITDDADERKASDAVDVSLPGGSQRLSDLPGLVGAPTASDGLGGDPASLPPALLWGFATLLVGLGWWWLFRRWRHPGTWFAGVVPFAVVLLGFFFYVERLLPSGY